MKNISHTRNDYLDRIAPFFGAPIIKVLTGMRRSGKSFLLRQIMQRLRHDGIPARNIVYIDKEDYAFDDIRDYHALAAFVDKSLAGTRGRVAICVDEIQEIEGWERIVASWAAKPEREIFITGSNARMLSSELATLLAGRYIEFPVRPLSFAEFLQFRGKPAPPPPPRRCRISNLPALWRTARPSCPCHPQRHNFPPRRRIHFRHHHAQGHHCPPSSSQRCPP